MISQAESGEVEIVGDGIPSGSRLRCGDDCEVRATLDIKSPMCTRVNTTSCSFYYMSDLIHDSFLKFHF